MSLLGPFSPAYLQSSAMASSYFGFRTDLSISFLKKEPLAPDQSSRREGSPNHLVAKHCSLPAKPRSIRGNLLALLGSKQGSSTGGCDEIQLTDLLVKMLNMDPSRRPTANLCRNEPFVASSKTISL